MTPLLDDGKRWRVVHGDTLALLPDLPDESVDAVVCDPPYGIDFKGHHRDGRLLRHVVGDGRPQTPGHAFEAWTTLWGAELRRVLKPGGFLLAFGSPRMAHRLTSGLEDSGLEIRDMLMWMFGFGMPKSRRFDHGRAATLKPFYEPIVLARRPVRGSVTANLDDYGTGALNVDACSIPSAAEPHMQRWPPNVAVSHNESCGPDACKPTCPVDLLEIQQPGASRFLYCNRATRRERDAGCEHLPARSIDHYPSRDKPAPRPLHNPHPTVKPVGLMRWLVRLITPRDGVVLDPFCGSGSTGVAAALEQRRFIGFELDPEFVEIARARIAHWTPDPDTGGAEGGHQSRPTRAGRSRRPA